MKEGAIRLSFPIVSVNVGRVQFGMYKDKEAKSGISKSRVEDELELTPLGLQGDEQADLINHGGPDKAVCVYNIDHYPHWENVLRQDLPYGAFGENFTVRGMNEHLIHVGDTFQVGSAVVQVSQPRQPCWKLAMKWGLDELPLLVTNSGMTGFYFRVLQMGKVKAVNELTLLEQHPARLTVAEANRIMHHDRDDITGLRQVLAVDALSASWVNTLTKRLDRLNK